MEVSHSRMSTTWVGSGPGRTLEKKNDRKLTYGMIYGVISESASNQNDGWDVAFVVQTYRADNNGWELLAVDVSNRSEIATMNLCWVLEKRKIKGRTTKSWKKGSMVWCLDVVRQ